MAIMRQLCGIVAGASGQDRTFQVPQPGETVLIARQALFENGWFIKDRGTGRTRHGCNMDREDLYYEPADFDAEDGGLNGAYVGAEYSEVFPSYHLGSTDSVQAMGGVASAGPIGVDITHGDTNHGIEGTPQDLISNTLDDETESPSMMWYDWRCISNDSVYLHTIRVQNTAGMYRWAGMDTDAKLSTVTGGPGHALDYTGKDVTVPILSAVRGEFRHMEKESKDFELAAFHSHFGGTTDTALSQWDLWGNAKDGISVKHLTGRESVTAGSGTTGTSGILNIYTDNGSNLFQFASGASGNSLQLNSAGSPTVKFNNTGTVDFLNTTENTGNDSYSVNFAGSARFEKNVEMEADLYIDWDSDERLKKNISTFKNATDMVGKLRGVEFDWKEEANKPRVQDYGVIAQDVQKVLPHAVKERESGTLAVDYIRLTPLLIEAVKELTERVKYLENKNNKTSF